MCKSTPYLFRTTLEFKHLWCNCISVTWTKRKELPFLDKICWSATHHRAYKLIRGIRLELCSEDGVGLLSDVTFERMVCLLPKQRSRRGDQRGTKWLSTLQIVASSNPVKSETIEKIRKEIGLTILRAKGDTYSTSPPQQPNLGFSLGSSFRSRSEKFLYNILLIKSCS